ncbi:hypothetical protein P154DRAFT_549753 [Amniculicola lignicola CBS 123094]|uniref:Uncharacterized protein n=1 Tax=Amniculicola lignicola CBS 123094 TaxID=1392246 RepID=A0A6A5VWP8_9PLEO|nr:hypothetical protein P154DRAFT_549753 [Amniculicola lignicola CBS 123094]
MEPFPTLVLKVSCYILLSGFRLPWPPSCCLDELTPFVVSSCITSSAYQKWPTSNDTFKCPRSIK